MPSLVGNYQTQFTFCKAQSLDDMRACIFYRPSRKALGRKPTFDDERCIFADEVFGLCDGLCYCQHEFVSDSPKPAQSEIVEQPQIQLQPKAQPQFPDAPSLADQAALVENNPEAQEARRVLAQYGITEDSPGVKYVPSAGIWVLRLRKHGWPKAPDVDYFSTKGKWRDVTTTLMHFGSPESLIMFLRKGRGKK